MNDLKKKKNKCLLFTGNTELFRKYVESILFFSNPKKIFYFTINNATNSDLIMLDRYEYQNGQVKMKEKVRKITNKTHL